MYALVCHYFYMTPLFNYSIKELIPWLQTHLTGNLLLAMQLVSFIVDDGKYIWILMFYAFFNRAAAFYVIFSTILLSQWIEIVKLVYTGARPFMVGDMIQVSECSPTFGRPSGHVWGVTVYGTLLLLSFCDTHEIRGCGELFHRGEAMDSNRRQTCHTSIRGETWFRVAAFIGLILVIALTGVSRMTLGVHSLDQVLYGFTIGLGLTVMWYSLTRNILQGAFLKVSECITDDVAGGAIQWVVTLVLPVCMFLLGYVAFRKGRTFEIPQEWQEEYTQKCGALPDF